MTPGVRRIENNQWRFTLWAPAAERVEVEFVHTAQRIDLEKDQNGYWTATMASVPGGGIYWYRLNGDVQRADPASAYQPDGVQGASCVVDHDLFRWTDSKYEPVALADYIIYELHIGTLTPEGTFDAAAQRLEDLKTLGITAVEVMPVAQFPGGRNWGYDGVFPYAVQNSYGGPEGLKRFVDAAHGLGLAVILDVVYNHLGPEGNYLRDFGPYFTDHYKTPWGEAVNFDRAYSDQVRDYFIENALYWLGDYHIDALRLDALHAVFDMSAKHFIQESVERVQGLSTQLKRPFYVIGESDLNDVRLIKPISDGGYGLDAQWSDDFHHALHGLLMGERFGYYQDFGAVSDLAKAMQEGFVYDWRYSPFRKRKHGSSSLYCPASQFVVCIQNHDQIGNRMRGDRLGHRVDFERLKLAAGCVLLSPYIPLLFMGEEYGEDHPFQYFISMQDADLVEAVQQGRAEEFMGFESTGQCPDPQASETFEQSKLQWDTRRQDRHGILLAFYQHLIHLRKSRSGFVNKINVTVEAIESQGILCCRRQWDAGGWLCLMNFSGESQTVRFTKKTQTGHKILDSAQSRWGGPGASLPETLNDSQNAVMPPTSLCLYETMTDTP